jgi:hypothetical protein
MTLYKKTFENFEKNFIGSSTMAVIGQSCLGAAAVMYILSNGTSILQMTQLTIIVLICMLVNTSILAQMNHKLVFNLIITSALCSALLIFLNNVVL